MVDPDKFDFYAMDCYRIIGDDKLAKMLVRETLRKSAAPDGTDLSPMRKAEAEITLGVIAARDGSVDEALRFGYNALQTGRRSQPSLLMVSTEFDQVLRDLYPANPDAQEFRQALASALRTGLHG